MHSLASETSVSLLSCTTVSLQEEDDSFPNTALTTATEQPLVPTPKRPCLWKARAEANGMKGAPPVGDPPPGHSTATLDSVPQAVSSVASSECRTIKIDHSLLELLARMSPPLLGGRQNAADSGQNATDRAGPEGGSRKNAEVKQIPPLLKDSDLTELYAIVTGLCATLSVDTWKAPRTHTDFRYDGGWPLYVLKLHQLVLACLVKETTASLEPAATTASLEPAATTTSLEPAATTASLKPEATTASLEPAARKEATASLEPAARKAADVGRSPVERARGESTAPVVCSTAAGASERTNELETRALWHAALRAAGMSGAVEDETELTRRYEDDAYRDYHWAGRMAGETPRTQQSPTIASVMSVDNETLRTSPTVIGVSSTVAETRSSTEALSNAQRGPKKENSDNAALCFVLVDDAVSTYAEELSRNLDPERQQSPIFVRANLQKVSVCLDMDLTSFALLAGGRYDAYLWALFLYALKDYVFGTGWLLRVPPIFNGSEMMVERRAAHSVRVFRDCMSEGLSEARAEYLSHMLLTASPSAVDEALNELQQHVWHAAFQRENVALLKRLEGILVALLGHFSERIRTAATVLLNNFYDRHDWQSTVPLVPVVKQVGDQFEVTVSVEDTADPSKGETPVGVFLILSAPAFYTGCVNDVYSYQLINWIVPSATTTDSPSEGAPTPGPTPASPVSPAAGIGSSAARVGRQSPPAWQGSPTVGSTATTATVERSRRRQWVGTVRLGAFPRCGFFDWRVVRCNEEFGSWEPVQVALSDLRRAASSRVLDLNISLTADDEGDFENLPSSTTTRQRNRGVGQVYPHPQRMEETLHRLLESRGEEAGPGGGNLKTFPLQGRFIVQPRGTADEQLHEIFIDQHGCEFDKGTGGLRLRGSFASVTASLSSLRQQGVTMLYLMGALSRDNGSSWFLDTGGVSFERPDASPFAITCRCSPNRMSGGPSGLLALMQEARRLGMKIVLDSFVRVASSRTHRKYEPHFLKFVDEQGKKAILHGSGGRGCSFEETSQLNYRKVECWDLLASDMKVLANVYGVDGLRLENAQSWPPIFRGDEVELQRKDADGSAHYPVMERLMTDVVLPFTEDTCGFWGTASARHWANPFLVKLCKELWREHCEFLLLAECLNGPRDERQGALARSGVVPQLQDIPQPLAKVFGQCINEDGTVVQCQPEGVEEIISWFNAAHAGLPEGALVIQSSCSHLSPMPALLYGRGAWPAVDLLFFLPDIPATFAGEAEGECFRLDVTNIFQAAAPTKDRSTTTTTTTTTTATTTTVVAATRTATADAAAGTRTPERPGSRPPYRAARSLVNLPCSDDLATSRPLSAIRTLARLEPVTAMPELEAEHYRNVGPEYGFDLRKIRLHYNHRRQLRHHLRILRGARGVLVPLRARQGDRWLSSVLCFLRFDPDTTEFVLIAINFSQREVTDLTISLRVLAQQFRNAGLQSSTAFISTDIFAADIFATHDPTRTPTTALHTTRGGTAHTEDKRSAIPLIGSTCTLRDVLKVTSTTHLMNGNVYSTGELLHQPQTLRLAPYETACIGFRPLEKTELSETVVRKLYNASLERLERMVRTCGAAAMHGGETAVALVSPAMERILRFNFVMESMLSGVFAPGLDQFCRVLSDLSDAIARRAAAVEVSAHSLLHSLLVDSLVFGAPTTKFDPLEWRQLCCASRGGAASVLGRKDPKRDAAEGLVAKMLAVASRLDDTLKEVSSTTTTATTSTAPLPPEIEEQQTDVFGRPMAMLSFLRKLTKGFIDCNNLGPIVFVTMELGKWSTVGGLGVMVDELSTTMAQHLGQTVYVVTPYYDRDRRGEPAKFSPEDNITYRRNISMHVGGETVELGVHEGRVRGVGLIFLHSARFFPSPYPRWGVAEGLRALAVIGKAALEVLCQKQLVPQLIITNDWPTGLVAAYGKNPHFFGNTFTATTFFHIIHNLDASYEGRLYADRNNNLSWITELSTDLLVDPLWQHFLYNPSRCALLCSDAWGTVSPSYCDALRAPGGSPLGPLLNRYPQAFAYPNGVPLGARRARLAELPVKTHEEAKAQIQQKYFGFAQPDFTIPLFAFIGRITEQKGVHLVVEAAERLIPLYASRLHILIGGKVNWTDPYSASAGRRMLNLRQKFPFSFYAAPDEFFADGPLVNLGADCGLMPSKFEPGGIVQHEFFLAGTPVLAFRTGGLKDSVFEFTPEDGLGNGWTFESYTLGDFLYAMERAIHRIGEKWYPLIRENARYSVISCEQVAQAWVVEFCRLRRKLPVNSGRVKALAERLTKGWDPLAWLVEQQGEAGLAPQSGAATVAATHEYRHTAELGSSEAVFGKQRQRAARARERREVSPNLAARLRFAPTKRGARPRAVAVAGTFDEWQVRRPMVWDNALGCFTLTLALPPGRYMYKLIVDGEWTLNPGYIQQTDSKGNVNNVLVVD